ncbi:MAG: ECF RNA polymerase sigma factor SigR [Candidatus Binatia bacterium]|nr:MAG: ECF RNA polymerase sigma factor SigR [Candidatus Binatia bacterium]
MPVDKAAKQAEFARWALPYMDHLYSVGLHLTRNPEDAEDLLQETYLRAYRFWHQFTPGTNCKAWLLTILYNTFRNRYRDSKRREGSGTTEDFDTVSDRNPAVEPHPSVEHEVLEGLLDDEVERALAELPDEYREVVLLVDVQELRYEEAAQVLGCPVGTVRSRLFRARRSLERRLRSYAEERGLARSRGER